MLANDMRKGQMGTLKDTRWRFRIEDNLRGMTRLATVWGLFTEMGSIYVHDIAYLDGPNGPEPLDLTPEQQKKASKIKAMEASLWG